MPSNNRGADVVIRLLARDEGLREALVAAGKDGERALRQLDKASQEASPGLKAVDNVANDVKNSMGGLLDRLGPLGSALRGLGPIGAGVGVLLGGVAVGALAAANAGAQAVTTIAALGDQADKLNLTTDAYQALRFEADALRISQSDLDSAIQTADKTTSEAALGTGEFFSNLNILNPEMVRTVQTSDDLNDRLAAISKGYREAETEVERNSILLRTFGDNGIRAGKALLGLEGGLEGATDRAREAGVVFSEDLIRASQEAAAEIAIADRKIEASKLRLKVAYADFAVSAKNAQAGVFNQLSSLGTAKTLEDEVNKVERARDRLLAFRAVNTAKDIPPILRPIFGNNFQDKLAEFQDELDDLNEQIAAQSDNDAIFQSSFIIAPSDDEGQVEVTAALQSSLNRLRQEAQTNAERLTAALTELDQAREAGLITSDAEFNRLRATLQEKFKDVDAINAQAKAIQELEKQRIADAAAARQAIQIRADLGDITGRLTQKEKELDALVQSGHLNRDEANRSLTKFREGLDGTTAARDKLTQALQNTLDPVARFNAETERLRALQDLANISAADFNKILADRAARLQDLQDAADDELEIEQFGETLEAAAERIKESLLTADELIDQKIEVERKIVDALVSEGVLSSAEAAQRLSDYRKDLEEINQETNALSAANDLLGAGINELTEGMGQFERAAVEALAAVALEALGLGDSLGGIFGGGGGGISGGGGFGNILGSAFAGIFHSGTKSVGSGGPKRAVNPAVFAGAPRFHNGIASVGRNEVPAILERGERVSTESETRALVNAINLSTAASAAARSGFGTAAPAVTLIVNNSTGEPVESEERTGPNGEREILLQIGEISRRQTEGFLKSARGAQVMSETFAINPRLGGR